MSNTTYEDLQAALPIPPEGIASRPLLDIKGGVKVVLFALDRGQEISPHQTPFPAEVVVVSGRMAISVGDGSWEVGANERIDLPVGLAHGLVAVEPSHFVLTMLRGTKTTRRHGHESD
jgi:quercetin dioxygenase-like cupin family protein